MTGAGPSLRVTGDRSMPPPDWDARAVDVPGGHVMQSTVWGGLRARAGFEPRYLSFEDGRVALALLRRSRGLPGVDAVVRRGPARAGDDGASAAARAAGLAAWARSLGARSLFLDPELPADPAYRAEMAAAGFSEDPGLEPSIHVMRLDFAPVADAESLLHGFSKSTRQRIRSAQQAGVSVRETRDPARMADFAELLHERADVVGMRLRAGTGFVAAWQELIGAGLARLLLADHHGELVGGLLLFRQGGIMATAYSADRAERRRELPGTMHLVRWTAIHDAWAEGCPAIELGGVDLPGHRSPPQPGDPNRGLYEHKRGFGAEWLEREPAHRIVLRPMVEGVARFGRRSLDALARVRR